MQQNRYADFVKVLRKASRRESAYERRQVAKAADRTRDWRRLVRQESTPEKVQAENALFTHCAELQILNLTETVTYFRRHQCRRP